MISINYYCKSLHHSSSLTHHGVLLLLCLYYFFLVCTMLQKLSKCEVKAWLCWFLIFLPPLRFYVKSNFGKFKQSKNVTFGNSRDSVFWVLVNLGLESSSNLLKHKFRPFKIVKINIFGLFEFAKIGFHVKSERR